MTKTWPHAPLHLFNEQGTYMVTGATLHKQHLFKEGKNLDFLQDSLLELAARYCWDLEACAIFSNHYHFIAQSPENVSSLQKFIRHFHSSSARYLNHEHRTEGRKVWYQYWESHITFQTSYLARLNYVMQNPVKHRLVDQASLYNWCSTGWFERVASNAFYQTVTSFKTDTVNVMDDF